MAISISIQDEHLSFTLDDTNITNDILSHSDKVGYFKQLLLNGYNIGKCIVPLSGQGILEGKIDELSTLMQPFNTGGNSSKNGQLGEIFASLLFIKRNPDVIYEDTSQIKKSGDAIITIQNHIIDKIMIDYKNYNSPVPSDEIDKLVRDLDAQNIKFGILLSYKSKISKHKNIDYSIIDNKLIVFIAAYGLDIFTLEMAIQYIMRLHECNILSISQQVSDLVVKGIMKNIKETYEAINDLACMHSQHINSMKENHEKINKMFHGMVDDGRKVLTHMNILVDKVKENIHEIHKEPITNIHSYTELNNYIDQLVDKEKERSWCKRILNKVHELNISGYYSDTDNCIHISNIGKLYITKSKITMIFYCLTDTCMINPTYEEVKHNNIYIILSDDIQKWNIIERRFIVN